MSHPETIEKRMLKQVDSELQALVSFDKDKGLARLSILEEVSCLHSGIPIETYRQLTGYASSSSAKDKNIHLLLSKIESTPIPFALSLASLSQIDLDAIDTKENGAVYTDYRLASYLAEQVLSKYVPSRVLDPACGTAILLAACAEMVDNKGQDVRRFVSDSLFGIDKSSLAIRGATLTLASFLKDADELTRLCMHLKCFDSLMLGQEIPSNFGLQSFDCIIGNPPWERIRPSRTEYLQSIGYSVTYGESIKELPDGYKQYCAEVKRYSKQLAEKYELYGEIDYYKVFLMLAKQICDPEGVIALYLPAGLIRSKGLAGEREMIVDKYPGSCISVFMNHSKFFAIDSRFKFILAVLSSCQGVSEVDGIRLNYCSGNEMGVQVNSTLMLERRFFSDCSGMLGVPEVRNEDEADTLKLIWQNSERMCQHSEFCNATPVREFDMTLDRSLFSQEVIAESYPIIEGRMISQFRCGCKEYIEGDGRSSKWLAVPMGSSKIVPHFFCPKDAVTPAMRERVDSARIGYCDIAGQTNERAMQASIIPGGCACGNKVPTILFGTTEASLLWLGIVNSFAFDWVVRRYITTTINHFILNNMPFPAITRQSRIGREIIQTVKRILDLEDGVEGWSREEIWRCALERSLLDALVFRAYGLSAAQVDVVLSDFPLVDRENEALFPGVRPTMALVKYQMTQDEAFLEEARQSWEQGALPYVPNEHARAAKRQAR